MGSREKFETLENNGLEISVNTKMIKKVQITESLGLTIHEHLTWKNNINNIIKKICSGISALKRSRDLTSRETVVVKSYSWGLVGITYCSPI